MVARALFQAKGNSLLNIEAPCDPECVRVSKREKLKMHGHLACPPSEPAEIGGSLHFRISRLRGPHHRACFRQRW